MVLHYRRLVYDLLQNYPEIEVISASGNNTPYTYTNNNSDVGYNDKYVHAEYYFNDDNYEEVVGLNLIEGRWFNHTDDASRLVPVVINKFIRDAIFERESAVGKTVKMWGNECIVVGVLDEYRQHGEFIKPGGSIFRRLNYNSPDFWYSHIVFKVKQGTGVEFEEQMIKDIQAVIPGWTMEVVTVADKREIRKKIALIPDMILFFICGFLILNVALGLFGALWYNINKRSSEIGLRRAVGSTGRAIQQQFVSETLVLATLGVMGGCLIAFQFPLLNVFNLSLWIYFLAIVISTGFIYALAALCAWYPGRQAAKIEPAMALHEE